ncbi:MAG TPA: hypothetical protein VIQ26_06520 [Microbacteriaceae bacterium]
MIVGGLDVEKNEIAVAVGCGPLSQQGRLSGPSRSDNQAQAAFKRPIERGTE